MQQEVWRDWLRRITGAQTSRGIAEKIGTSHTTVQRWCKTGIPPAHVFKLSIRFNADIYRTLVLFEWLEDGDVEAMNLEAAVRHFPEDVLAAEIHRRAVARAVRAQGPALSDTIGRQSFRLTGKDR
jgi:hypothetical protein